MKPTRFALTLLICIPLVAISSDQTPPWDYDGAEGPENWGDLAAEFDMCRRGKSQSPIDLDADFDAELPTLVFDYGNPGIRKEVNTGHAIQENVSPGNYVSLKGEERRYELKQFHFHSPSEHTVNGKSYPMEVHFVHQNADGELMVLGLMFREGARNERMDQLPSFRAVRGEAPAEKPFDYNKLVKGRDQYFYYSGSLTTPPCSEGVRWVVFEEPIIASAEQIAHFHRLLGFDNNRPVQPINARIVVH